MATLTTDNRILRFLFIDREANMFSLMFVCPKEGVCITACICARGCMGRDVCGRRGGVRGVSATPPPPMATDAVAAHPTGMHSCFRKRNYMHFIRGYLPAEEVEVFQLVVCTDLHQGESLLVDPVGLVSQTGYPAWLSVWQGRFVVQTSSASLQLLVVCKYV